MLRVFELAAGGISQAGIAKRLNADGVASPRPQRGRPAAWAPATVHEVLHRDRYRGELVWNRTRKRDQLGQRRGSDRPESDWIRVPAPELRIVPDELWSAAHALIAARAAKSTFSRDWSREAKYLLTGLARCASCNGGLCVRTSGRPGGVRRRSYACTSHYLRAARLCKPRPDADGSD